MEPNHSRNSSKIIAGLAVLVVTVVIVFGAKALQAKKPDTHTTAQVTSAPKPAATTNTTPSAPTTPTTPAATTSAYKDGTYSATGKYNSPGGAETITVHVTLAGDTITETSAQSGANDPTAQEFQDDFISGYKTQVVGKAISSIHLSHVSGSSLTSQGFNSAIAQIKSQAKSS